MKKERGYGDGTMLSLHRTAVRIAFGYRCFFCGTPIQAQELEAHHIIKRKGLLLRYAYRNGVLLCKWPHKDNAQFKMSCHRYAETPAGKRLIDRYLEEMGYMDYLMERTGSSKQYFVERGITRIDYVRAMKTELIDFIQSQEG